MLRSTHGLGAAGLALCIIVFCVFTACAGQERASWEHCERWVLMLKSQVLRYFTYSSYHKAANAAQVQHSWLYQASCCISNVPAAWTKRGHVDDQDESRSVRTPCSWRTDNRRSPRPLHPSAAVPSLAGSCTVCGNSRLNPALRGGVGGPEDIIMRFESQKRSRLMYSLNGGVPAQGDAETLPPSADHEPLLAQPFAAVDGAEDISTLDGEDEGGLEMSTGDGGLAGWRGAYDIHGPATMVQSVGAVRGSKSDRGASAGSKRARVSCNEEVICSASLGCYNLRLAQGLQLLFTMHLAA
jgi:hypothetical protein